MGILGKCNDGAPRAEAGAVGSVSGATRSPIIYPLVGPTERIANALEIAAQYAGIEGEDHKAWVIDRMVLALTGEENYEAFVQEARSGERGPNGYDWHYGTAP